MKKSDQLKLERTAKVEAQGKLLATAKAENNRALTDAENASFDALDGEITELDSQIERAVKIEKAEVRAAELEGRQPLKQPEGDKPAKRGFSLNKAIRALMDGVALDGPELEAQNRANAAAKEAGVGLTPRGLAIPMFSERTPETRADGQTVTGDSGGYGATAVATDKGDPIDYLRPELTAEKAGARVLTGLIGNLSFPKNNGGITAVWKGEVETVDPTKDAWGEVELTPKRLTVRVPISLQNLMQSSFDMEVYTMKTIRDEIANKLDKAILVGSGSGEPTGIINTSGVNTLAGGTNGAAPTWPIVVGLETPVFTANANSARMAYISNSKVRGKLKNTPKESGQATYLMDDSGKVNGYPYFNSNHLPSTLTKGSATSICSAAIFGDMSQSVIAIWGFMDITLDDKSRKKDGYIELVVNCFADVAVLQPTAFTVIKDLLTA